MVLYVSCRPGHLTGFIWNFNIPRQYEKVPSGNKETIGERKGNKTEGFYCVSPLKTNNKQTKKTSVPLPHSQIAFKIEIKCLSLAVKLYFSLLHATSQIILLLSLWVDLYCKQGTLHWLLNPSYPPLSGDISWLTFAAPGITHPHSLPTLFLHFWGQRLYVIVLVLSTEISRESDIYKPCTFICITDLVVHPRSIFWRDLSHVGS